METKYENFEGEVVERVLASYSLICKSSIWYLLAEREGELRTYRVDRFRSVRVLDQSFSRRPDFDLPAYWRTQLQSFGASFDEYHCTLRIHPSRVSFVKWLMPGRWEVIGEADDRGWVTFSLGMDSDLLAKMLVFGLAETSLAFDTVYAEGQRATSSRCRPTPGSSSNRWRSPAST